MAELRYLEGVTTLELNREACTGCGMCATVCPHGVLAMEEGKARIAERDRCMECGACARNCPVAALSRQGRSRMRQRHHPRLADRRRAELRLRRRQLLLASAHRLSPQSEMLSRPLRHRPPDAEDAVAAGDGAFRTCTIPSPSAR